MHEKVMMCDNAWWLVELELSHSDFFQDNQHILVLVEVFYVYFLPCYREYLKHMYFLGDN